MTKEEFDRLNVVDKLDQIRFTLKNTPEIKKQEVFDLSEILFNYRKNNTK